MKKETKQTPSPSSIEKIISDAFDAGSNYGAEVERKHFQETIESPDRETYLKSVTTPTPSPSIHGEGKFTKGEWMVKTNNGREYLLVETNDKDCKTICKCLAMPFEEISIEEAESNARLIAQSKNMYLALKEFVDHCEKSNSNKFFFKKEIESAKAILNRIQKH